MSLTVCSQNAIFIRNHIAHSTTGASPYFLMCEERPSLKHARVFGCTAYVLGRPYGAKFKTQGLVGVLLEVLYHGVYKVLSMNERDSPMIVES